MWGCPLLLICVFCSLIHLFPPTPFPWQSPAGKGSVMLRCNAQHHWLFSSSISQCTVIFHWSLHGFCLHIHWSYLLNVRDVHCFPSGACFAWLSQDNTGFCQILLLGHLLSHSRINPYSPALLIHYSNESWELCYSASWITFGISRSNSAILFTPFFTVLICKYSKFISVAYWNIYCLVFNAE